MLIIDYRLSIKHLIMMDVNYWFETVYNLKYTCIKVFKSLVYVSFVYLSTVMIVC